MEGELSLNNIERALSIIPETEEEKTVEIDPLSSNMPIWSTRFKSFQAYFCYIMSFSAILTFSKSLGEFGGAVFIPYSFFRMFFGTPVVVVECMLGRYIMGYVSSAWNMCPLGKGVFYCSIVTAIFTIIYNYISSVYLIKYLISLFHGQIPWEYCQPPWAQFNCYEVSSNNSAYSKCLDTHSREFCDSIKWETSGLQFWKYQAGNSHKTSSVAFSLLYSALSIIIVLICNYKKIKSLEKVLVIFTYGPLILASIIAFISFLIPGTLFGLKKLWYFKLSTLLNQRIWLSGFEEVLIALGVGICTLTFISSHCKFLDDILYDILVVFFSDLVCSTLIISPILSVVASIKYPKEGEGGMVFEDNLDVFVSMSDALILYPYPKALWALVFYLEMFLITMGTQAILVMTVCEAIVGLLSKDFASFYNVSVIFEASMFILVGFFLFIPYYFSYPFATVIATTMSLGILTLVAFYGIQRFYDDFHFMMGYPPPHFLKIPTFTTALILVIFLGLKMYYMIPNEPIQCMVYIYILVPILIYVISAVFEIVKAFKQGKVSTIFTVNLSWGLHNPILKKSRIIFNSQTITKEFMYRQELYKKPSMKPPEFAEQNIVQIF